MESGVSSEKLQRMQELALSLFRSGKYQSAMECWRKIKAEQPDFPDIDKWIQSADRKLKEERQRYSLQKRSPDASPTKKTRPSSTTAPARKAQPERLAGTSRKAVRKESVSKKSRSLKIRHRYIGIALVVGMLFVFLASLRNTQNFMLVLNPETGEVDCYKGTFFPYGWEKENTLNIGLTPGWEKHLGNNTLTRKLQHGLRVHGVDKLNEIIIQLYNNLGLNALKTKTIEKQQEAIYYFKRIEKAGFKKLIAWNIATAYYNLAHIYAEKKANKTAALQYLNVARQYIPSYPEVDKLLQKIHSLPNPTSRFY